MSNKNKGPHSDFIDKLVKDHKPVKPLWSPEKRSLLILSLYPVAIALIMLAIQPFRDGCIDDLLHTFFSLEMLLGAISVSSFTYFSLSSVIPGSGPKNKYLWLSLGSLSILVLLLVKGIYVPHKQVSMLGKRPTCYYEILTLGILPFTHLVYLCKKGVIFFKARMLFAAALASALIPALLMHMACMYDPLHVLEHHLVPVLFFTLGAGIISYLLIKKS